MCQVVRIPGGMWYAKKLTSLVVRLEVNISNVNIYGTTRVRELCGLPGLVSLTSTLRLQNHGKNGFTHFAVIPWVRNYKVLKLSAGKRQTGIRQTDRYGDGNKCIMWSLYYNLCRMSIKRLRKVETELILSVAAETKQQ